MATRSPIRTLLWFDCIAAGVAGVAMLALSGVLAPVFGISRSVLVTTALVNLAYGTFSYSLARQPEAPRRHVRILIAANAAWTVVCRARGLGGRSRQLARRRLHPRRGRVRRCPRGHRGESLWQAPMIPVP